MELEVASLQSEVSELRGAVEALTCRLDTFAQSEERLAALEKALPSIIFHETQ